MTQKEIHNSISNNAIELIKEGKFNSFDEYAEACKVLKTKMEEAYAQGETDLGDTLANALMTVQVRATKELGEFDKMKFIANCI